MTYTCCPLLAVEYCMCNLNCCFLILTIYEGARSNCESFILINNFDFVQGAHLHWKDIGRKLKMGHTETSSIVTTPGLTQTKDYFQELLHRWLKWAPPIHPFPTTEDLADGGGRNLAYKLICVKTP